MALTLELAERICALHFDDLSPDLLHWAKVGIIDTVGVTLAGSGRILPGRQNLEPLRYRVGPQTA